MVITSLLGENGCLVSPLRHPSTLGRGFLLLNSSVNGRVQSKMFTVLVFLLFFVYRFFVYCSGAVNLHMFGFF